VKFGYSVTGDVHPDRIWKNAGAKVGDRLVLTKPLGTGIIVRATKFGRSTAAQLTGAVESMLTLNRTAAEVAKAQPPEWIHACTDVTGFGLAGHATEIALASDVTLAFDSASLPVLPGAIDLAVQNLPCGGRSNQRHYDRLKVEPGVRPELFLICCDPQTSGGLLFSIPAAHADAFVAAQQSAGVPATIVGLVEPRSESGALVRLR
jgi:selenide,water dikinase